MSSSGIIFNIQRFSVNDGPGIRTTIFFKGCPLACWWCHNPEGKADGVMKINGQTIGKQYTKDELLSIIEKDRVFYDDSGGGVTFSGGEPLAQSGFLLELLKASQKAGIHTAVDTSGYADQDNFQKIIDYTDLFLYDLKLIDPAEHLKYTDISNTEILENLEFLIQSKKTVIIRIPLIPNITATSENLDQIINYLNKFDEKPEVNLLPYHKIAASKYDKFGFSNQMNNSMELSDQEIKQKFKLFENSGFQVEIGG